MTTPDPARKTRRGSWWLAAGVLLLLAAALLAGKNLWQQHRAAQSAGELLALAEARLEQREDTPAPPEGGQEEAAAGEALAGYEVDGILTIPALELSLPVLADYSEELLRVSVCLYSGTGGENPQQMVIAGHNYRAHFGRLGQLQPGDAVTYTAMTGAQSHWRVARVEEISAQDPAALEQGGWDMTLLTCNLDLSLRLLVRLEQADAAG